MTMTYRIEHLWCRSCEKGGDAELFEISPFHSGFQKVPEGFKLVDGDHGKQFCCIVCDQAVATHDSGSPVILICSVCRRPMKFLATLPSVITLPAEHVFLCRPCRRADSIKLSR